MKKILVPTDFSDNSKVGVQFAINWATKENIELIFLHVLYTPRLTRWSDSYYEKFREDQEKDCRIKLEKFVAGVYGYMNIKPGKHTFSIVHGISADVSVLDYCNKIKDINYICISTRGAGKLKKIFGTNTGNLIIKSKVPVLAIPKNFKVTDVKSILYSSDLRNYTNELAKVIDFASPLKASIDVVHFTWPDEIVFDEKILGSALKKKYKHGLNLLFEHNDAIHSLIQNLQRQIKLRNPSVVVMFTNQQRTFFQRLFLSSKAEELSFEAKVPLLVFNKTEKK